MSVNFSCADVELVLSEPQLLKKWIADIIVSHGKKLGKINYLFCSDEHIYETNVMFLNHDTYTDIITFDYVEGLLVSGDILISVDRVRDNAQSFSVPFEQELRRVIIHGVLHLLGFKDKTELDATEMRHKENESLDRYDMLKKE